MQRPPAYTLIELLVTIAIIGLLATIATVNFSAQRASARDANRRESLRAYQAALEQYRLAKGTYFVHGGDWKAATVTLDSRHRMQVAGDASSTGLEGGGWGGVNVAGPLSIAQVLRQDGYLKQIETDPSGKTGNANDYQLTLCLADSSSPLTATNPANSLEYALVARLEGANPDVTTNATGICNNANYDVLGSGTLGVAASQTFAVASRRW